MLSALLAIASGTAAGLFLGGSFRRLRTLHLRLAWVGVVGLAAFVVLLSVAGVCERF